MSDIYCKCGEPWDVDSLHDLSDEQKCSFDTARQMFREQGCKAFGSSCSNTNPAAGEIIALADELMGDDIDGVVSFLEDAHYLGLL